jgi:hypothetical protein
MGGNDTSKPIDQDLEAFKAGLILQSQPPP